MCCTVSEGKGRKSVHSQCVGSVPNVFLPHGDIRDTAGENQQYYLLLHFRSLRVPFSFLEFFLLLVNFTMQKIFSEGSMNDCLLGGDTREGKEKKLFQPCMGGCNSNHLRGREAVECKDCCTYLPFKIIFQPPNFVSLKSCFLCPPVLDDSFSWIWLAPQTKTSRKPQLVAQPTSVGWLLPQRRQDTLEIRTDGASY